MKLIKIKLPEKKVFEFAQFCETYDIKIVLSYSKEGIIDDDIVICILRVESTDIPQELKTEKLRERYNNYLTPKL